MKSILLALIGIVTILNVYAQNPTTVTASTNCVVVANFNSSDENFSSPSIFSDANDVSFVYNPAGGNEVENSGLATRQGSLISARYINSNTGYINVGFQFSAPAGTTYRIRIISDESCCSSEILATTANGPIFTTLPGTSGNLCLRLNDADLIAGQNIRVEFTFAVQGSNSPVIIDNVALSIGLAPLPVVFYGFVARPNQDGSLQLLWNVGTELDIQGYNVESSTDGVNFKNFAYVAASGKQVYSANYISKIDQTTYFRIKSVEFSGVYKYSTIIKVLGKDKRISNIQVYPNPATNSITIQHNSSNTATFTLMSTDGRMVMKKAAQTNTYQTQMNISALNKGMYFLIYDNGSGEKQTSKVLKN